MPVLELHEVTYPAYEKQVEENIQELWESLKG